MDVLLACCDVRWDECHPGLSVAEIHRELVDRGHAVQLLPYPLADCGVLLGGLDATSLLPVDTYGDVLLTLGVGGAVFQHPHHVVVDGADRVLRLTGALEESQRSLARASLQAVELVVVASYQTDDSADVLAAGAATRTPSELVELVISLAL